MNSYLRKISDEVAAGNIPPPVTTREFLSWFGAQRRGFWIVNQIRRELRAARLETMPDFEANFIDAHLQLIRENEVKEALPLQSSVTEIATQEHLESAIDISTTNPDWTRRDPTYRISKLGPANQQVISVKPDGLLAEVVAQLLLKNFSQLPVMTNEREVKGVITWASIGSRLALAKQPGKFARDFMEPHHEIRSNFSIFDAIPIIVAHQYVLVRGDDNRIIGIITASDLSEQFRLLAEPFLLLGEIENLLRGLIADRFSTEELGDVREPKDSSRKIQGPDDLAFGEYLRLLERPERWQQFGLDIDRISFCKDLDNVRRIRNDVMHFDSDGVLPKELDSLRDFKKFLNQIENIVSPKRRGAGD
jgi:CBS domain-containing protein